MHEENSSLLRPRNQSLFHPRKLTSITLEIRVCFTPEKPQKSTSSITSKIRLCFTPENQGRARIINPREKFQNEKCPCSSLFFGNFKSLRVYLDLPWVREIKSARIFSTSRVRAGARKFVRAKIYTNNLTLQTQTSTLFQLTLGVSAPPSLVEPRR